MGIFDVLDMFNIIDRVQGQLWGLTSYLPHRASHKGRKVGPWRIDGGTREIHVDREHTAGIEAERILKRVNISIAGRRVTDREAIFLVRERQASWAEYNLLRAGVALGPGHAMIDLDNVRRAGQYTEAVPAWALQDQRAGLPEEEAERSAPAEADKSNLQEPKRKRGGLLRELW
jgi:hypothetical protein